MRDDATMHRLWYDLRNQSQFEEKFRADVADIDHSLEQMIWRVVTRYAQLSERDLVVTPAFAYALLDGVFQHALLRHLGGDLAAAQELDEQVRQVLPTLLAKRRRQARKSPRGNRAFFFARSLFAGKRR